MTDKSIAQGAASVQVSSEDTDGLSLTPPAWLDAGAVPPLLADEDPFELLEKHRVNGAGYTATSAGGTQEAGAAAPDAARAATVAATVASIQALTAGVPHDVHDRRYDYLLPALRGLISTLQESERNFENVGQYLALLLKSQKDRDGFLASCPLPAVADETVTPAIFWGARLFTVSEFLERPPKQWLVDKVLGVQDFGLLYGESGHGKTHVGLDFAYTCATGGTFADTFPVTRPLTVAYATGEGIGGLTDRLRAVSGYYGTPDVPLYLFSDIPQLFAAGSESGAIAFVTAWQDLANAGRVPAQLDVLILDTLHNATAGADENSAKDAGVTQAALRLLRDKLGCAVLLLHHANKSGSSERGSTALRASCDTVLRAQKAGHSYSLSCEKLKDVEEWPALSFSLVAVNNCTSVRVFWEGQAPPVAQTGRSKLEARIMAQLDSQAGKRYTADEVAQAIKEDSRTVVQNTLKALRQSGAVLSTTEERRTKDGKTRSVYVYWRESDAQNEVSQ